MTGALTYDGALEQAVAALRGGGGPARALALLQDIPPTASQFARAQHLRGVAAVQQGDPRRGLQLLFDAFERGERSGEVIVTLARVIAMAGASQADLLALCEILKRNAAQGFGPLIRKVLQALGFTSRQATPANAAVFEHFVLPLLEALLERRDMDAAIDLEGLVYEGYVKAEETEAHFAAVMGRLEPLFTRAGRAWREALPPLPQPSLSPPYRIGFLLHNASMLAHVEVLLNTLKGYRLLDDQPFEPTVYCMGGKSPPMEAALSALGVRLVMLNERFPETARSAWQRLLRLRELLAEEGVQELVWISLVTMLPLAFGMRMAPVQTWNAMKYRNYAQPDIDGYVTGSALTRFGTVAGRRFRMARLGVDDWYDPALESEARRIRTGLDADVVMMTLARTEKMRDPSYLASLVEILQANPGAMFLWAGREEPPQIVEAFRAGGVLNRTRFIGWVNTRLFAQVADVFLDTFPFPCGFTLFQAMAAGKPVVIYDSPEAAQTGLWNFLRPLIDGEEGTAQERAELRTFVGDEASPTIPIARDPEDYVRQASRLIRDREARAAAGVAAQGFIARYFSDPRQMGRSFAEHFVELIEEAEARGRAISTPAGA